MYTVKIDKIINTSEVHATITTIILFCLPPNFKYNLVPTAIATNAEITQTLSLIGKEVTVTDPDDKEKRITGKVTEASFEDGTGKVKINDTYYSIANIVNVKDTSLN